MTYPLPYIYSDQIPEDGDFYSCVNNDRFRIMPNTRYSIVRDSKTLDDIGIIVFNGQMGKWPFFDHYKFAKHDEEVNLIFMNHVCPRVRAFYSVEQENSRVIGNSHHRFKNKSSLERV